MIPRSTDGKERILSLSYGKDSLACLGALEELGWPLDRIIHAEVWATPTIHADPPPMVEFKAKADRIIKERWHLYSPLRKRCGIYKPFLCRKAMCKRIYKSGVLD